MKKMNSGYILNARRRRRSNGAALAGYGLFFITAALLVWRLLETAMAEMPQYRTSLLFPGRGTAEGTIIVLFIVALLLISLRRAFEWERMIALRLGKFHAVKGPGLFWVIPFIDKIADTIDIRIRVTDFSAQGTLTRDSVTVTVDALCFWLVWDPQKAALEVEDYEEAVVLSSKTALRNAVSGHDLTTFLEDGEAITKSLQKEVDQKTTDWGITILYIEIHDIQIPEHLQDSLACFAQAERERKARILLADAEIEIAKRLDEAVAVYAKNADAMRLKILSVLNEGLKAGNSMMLVPNSLTEDLKTKDIFGLQALNEIKRTGSPA
jgi:regulator of protease activity HflC (stomatin/prohibitin superfamily)